MFSQLERQMKNINQEESAQLCRRRSFIGAGSAAAAGFALGADVDPTRRRFSMTVMNPKCMAGGAGLCVIMRTPLGKTCLFDTANGDIYGKSPMNNGKDIIAPWLRSHGIEKIDGPVISHYDADHFGGFLGQWDHFPFDRVFDCSYIHGHITASSDESRSRSR